VSGRASAVVEALEVLGVNSPVPGRVFERLMLTYVHHKVGRFIAASQA
jgi:hypothetical protein